MFKDGYKENNNPCGVFLFLFPLFSFWGFFFYRIDQIYYMFFFLTCMRIRFNSIQFTVNKTSN